MKKLLTLLILSAFLLTGCGMSWQGTYSEHIYTDEETGVQYIVFMAGANNSTSITVSPRYNADGTLHINKN